MLRAIALTSLLVLSSASSVLAQKKAETAGGSVANPGADTAETAGTSQKKPATKKAKKSKGSPPPSGSQPPASQTAESDAEPDAWERPPADTEKPPAPAAPVQRKIVGDGKHLSAGLVLGWGFLTDRKKARLGADAYRLELGVRGGYSFDFQLYLGAFYSYYLGSTNSGSTQGSGLETSSTANYMQFGVEGGYDIWAGSLIVRPSLQIGAALGFTNKLNTPSPVGGLLVAPGFTVLKPLDDFFIAGDMRLNFVSGDGNSAFVASANGGMRFE